MVAPLLAFPTELVHEILGLVQPEDLENFAQISRSFYSLASPFLIEHRSLIRQYHTFRNKADLGSLAEFLFNVIANPRIGSYVRRVELGQLDMSKNRYTEDVLETFTRAALDSECLKMLLERDVLDEERFWRNVIMYGYEDILLAILLPLLPNLATLSMDRNAGQSQWYASVIEKAAFASSSTLSKLKHIQLNPYQHEGCHLVDIQKLSALPSVGVLSARKAKGLQCLHHISLDLNSNVTDLKLWDSVVDSTALSEFLRGFAKLQSFTYSSESAIRPSHDAYMIRSSLLAHCKATLRSLTLLYPNTQNITFMGSLRGFETLKEIYTEWCLIIPESRSRGILLNDHMPTSLVRLKIHDSVGREKSEYEKVIKRALYAKEHRLQKLKWLVFGGIYVPYSLEDMDPGLRKTCSNLGITLIFSPYAPKSGDESGPVLKYCEKRIGTRTIQSIGVQSGYGGIVLLDH